nr:P2Y purinoceptor 1-like [Nothobranchius furzeri]
MLDVIPAKAQVGLPCTQPQINFLKDFNHQASSTMLLELYLRYSLVRNSSTYGFVWEKFDFGTCTHFERGRSTWACLSLLCFAVGFPASLLILWAMFQTHRRGAPFSPNDFFILNLSIMDAIFLAFIPPGLLNHYFIHTWPFEALWNSVYALNTCGRPFLMACMCFDCYLAVVHPIFYHKRKSLTPRVVSAAIIWSLTAANGIIYFLFYRLYFSFFPVATFVISLVIIGLCDGVIIYSLVKSGPGRRNIHPQKQRAIQTLVYSLATTTLSYLPPVILYSIGMPLTGTFELFVCTIALPITITATIGSTVMPVLYLYNAGKLNWAKIRS